MYLKCFLILFCLNYFKTNADVYLHNPRGSNNRLDEATRERATNNRLFDSENNQRGGYNVGNLYYYEGSQLQIEWTNQHSCNNENSNCDFIIQYMCADNLRDGATTSQMTLSNSQCQNNDCNSDYTYGMHEDYKYYETCSRRSRNKALFIADQVMRKQSAMNTRQNPDGNPSGYECSEERDYYPYWHPSPWIDIAILTNNAKKCSYYKSESENVKSRWYCAVPNAYIQETGGLIPNNKEDCEKLIYKSNSSVWTENPSHGVNAPDCKETQFTRDNHLGNTIGGNPPVYNWTIPNTPSKYCALRLRYNITTNDYDSTVDSNTKINLFPDIQNPTNRGYTLKNNPEVNIFADLDFKLKLAINTAQYGRVFQDRTHKFEIRNRPDELKDKIVKNLNVRGKRGNIVQVYPAVEYDFVPNKLELSVNDYIHFQWTGSNTNPLNNAGQGLAGTDRSNIVLLSSKKYDKGSNNPFSPLNVNGQYGANYPAYLSNSSFLGINDENRIKLATLQLNQFGGSMDELNDAGTYFNLDTLQFQDTGVLHYMCTRNNNFSNRDQKGEIIVNCGNIYSDTFGVNGGTLTFSDGQITIPEDALNELTYVRVDVLTNDEMKKRNLLGDARTISEKDLTSNYVIISPANTFTNKQMELKLKLNDDSSKLLNAVSTVTIYRINPDYSVMTKLSASYENEYAKVSIQEGGMYVAKSEKNYGLIIGLVTGISVLIIIVISITVFLIKNPKYVASIRNRAQGAKRTFANKV